MQFFHKREEVTQACDEGEQDLFLPDVDMEWTWDDALLKGGFATADEAIAARNYWLELQRRQSATNEAGSSATRRLAS